MPCRVLVVSQATDLPLPKGVTLTEQRDERELQPVVGVRPALVYWNIVGLAHAPRLALAYAGAGWDDVRINSAEAWFAVKDRLRETAGQQLHGMHFPNLPYYVDESVALSQSDAILRYLGRRHGLMGDPGKEHVVDQALDELKDMEAKLAQHSYRSGIDALGAWYKSEISVILRKWCACLGDRSFVTGSAVSVADLKLYGYLRKLLVVQGKLGDDATAHVWEAEGKWARAFLERVERLPRLREYLASEQHLTRPLNAQSALFNN